MIAIPIGAPEKVVVVGSPAYLAKRPAPMTPDDLAAHLCINRRLPTLGGSAPWTFVRHEKRVTFRVSGPLAFNSPELIVSAARHGFGLAYLFESQVADELRAGKLVAMLQDWCATMPGYHLYYPRSRQVTPGFQVLIDALRWRA